jgi:hypothetical protein
MQLGQQESEKEANRLQRLFGNKGERFSIKNKETFYDAKTGLTWMLLDSQLSTGQCMTYNEADQYIKSMKIGGHSDWRLPTAKELTALFSPPSPFQGSSNRWFWTSDSFKRYSGGWIILVDVVSAEPTPSITKQDSKSCGWFRAVRP